MIESEPSAYPDARDAKSLHFLGDEIMHLITRCGRVAMITKTKVETANSDSWL